MTTPSEIVPTYLRAIEIYGTQGLLRIGRSKFFALVAAGQLPKPLKCGRVSVWEQAELLAAFRGLIR